VIQIYTSVCRLKFAQILAAMYMGFKPLLSEVKFEDVKGVIRSVTRSSADNTMAKRKRTKRQTIMDKTLLHK